MHCITNVVDIGCLLVCDQVVDRLNLLDKVSFLAVRTLICHVLISWHKDIVLLCQFELYKFGARVLGI